MLKFISIARTGNKMPALGIGTDKHVYIASVAPWFMWRNNKLIGYHDGNIQQGYGKTFYDSLRLQRVNFFPFFFTKLTLLSPPEGYEGRVSYKTEMDGWWIVGA